jgi:peptidoglycan-associated lipoprotein
MMKRQIRILITFACSTVLLLSLACAKKQVREEAGPETGPAARQEQPAETEGQIEEGRLEEAEINAEEFTEPTTLSEDLGGVFQNIHFAFDEFSLRPEAKEKLKKIADWMLDNPENQLLIEGHCDERGTSEYNLALGERRANSAKKYLVQLGVSPQRISTISYGEEKPLDPRSTEQAWAKNRRCHFLIK